MTSGLILILSTFPDASSAKEAARRLVEKRLAACCSVIGGLASTYWWKGKIEEEREALLIVKTSAELYQKAEEQIRRLHPYEVPEIACFRAEAVLPEYLNWLREETLKEK